MNYKQQKELIELSHKYRLEELEFEKKCKKEVENLKHSNDLESQRIKTSEIRKSQQRKLEGDAYKY